MIINEVVNFTPDTPDTCRPTSGVVCAYCKNKPICNNVMERDDIFGVDNHKETVIIKKEKPFD